MPRISLTLLLLSGLTILTGCLEIEQSYTLLAPGRWRGVLQLEAEGSGRIGGQGALAKGPAMQFEEVTQGELPFEFDVIYPNPDSFYIVLINGEERIQVTDIRYGLDRRTARDTLVIDFPQYDTHIEAVCEAGVIQGYWVVNFRENYRIPFKAKYGEGYRFTQLHKPPNRDLTGHWAVTFSEEDGTEFPAVAEFSQDSNRLTGTFRTETGDLRYLEGTVQSDKLYLSGFDGAHAFLLEGKILDDGSLIGAFRSGKHYRATWAGQRDEHAELPNPDTLTRSVEPTRPVEFRFINDHGTPTSLLEAVPPGRPVILQIMGTWCPNCLDETRFLQDYRARYPGKCPEIVSLAFERYPDTAKVLQRLTTYREKTGLDWPLLWCGSSGKDVAGKALPFLDGIRAYPTLVFLDARREVRRIHTGFDGPATTRFAQFETDFHNFVQQLTGSSQ